MRRKLRLVLVLPLLALALGGCTSGAATTTTSTHGSSGVVVAGGGGSEVGNDRPHVSYDGLMVRRRVVIAIHPTPTGDLTRLRQEMDRAATRLHTTLTTISPSVLAPALVEQLAPEATVLLPAGQTLADATKIMEPAAPGGRRFPEVGEYAVASVLVHDLRFSVTSAKPADLAAAIDREGILSDALGNYTTTLGAHRLDFTYTGPLLGDDLVESVRAGIARRAGILPAAVTVSARSAVGVGVDMAREPAQAPDPNDGSTVHNHNHNAASPSNNAALPNHNGAL